MLSLSRTTDYGRCPTDYGRKDVKPSQAAVSDLSDAKVTKWRDFVEKNQSQWDFL